MKNLNFSTRLFGAFALLTLLLAGVVSTAVVQMGSLRKATTDITSNWLPSVSLVNRMNTNTSDYRAVEFDHVLNTDESAMRALEGEMARIMKDYEQNRDAYVKLISSAEERKIYDAFAADWQLYGQVHDKVIALSRRNANEEAKALLDGESKLIFNRSSAILDKVIELNQRGADAAGQSSEYVYFEALQTMAVVAAVALGVAVCAAFLLNRSITGPLKDAVAAADRVAGGDLTVPIVPRSHDEVGMLLKALQSMQDKLTQTVGTVRSNAQSVLAASVQIAHGNQDLSQRTEEQAAAVEQTSASMQQLSLTVQHSADNVRQASQLATSASTVAAQGGDVVAKVVGTMKGINESSARIGEIVGVIDGIAFQTNILALNAAVEAARAGEQGRGFAIVATEVRGLASRSATAASEIKRLIATSVERVEEGSALVDEAGKTMAGIVTSIQRVSDIMGEISAASNEQSTGVGQISHAVAQMDQVTQRNAALVEESAAAAEGLRAQAGQLVETVAVFRLTGRS